MERFIKGGRLTNDFNRSIHCDQPVETRERETVCRSIENADEMRSRLSAPL